MMISKQTYTHGNVFPYIFYMTGIKDRKELKIWMMENIGYYQGDWIWWGTQFGHPSVYIKDVESATAFKLRWG